MVKDWIANASSPATAGDCPRDRCEADWTGQCGCIRNAALKTDSCLDAAEEFSGVVAAVAKEIGPTLLLIVSAGRTSLFPSVHSGLLLNSSCRAIPTFNDRHWR